MRPLALLQATEEMRKTLIWECLPFFSEGLGLIRPVSIRGYFKVSPPLWQCIENLYNMLDGNSLGKRISDAMVACEKCGIGGEK